MYIILYAWSGPQKLHFTTPSGVASYSLRIPASDQCQSVARVKSVLWLGLPLTVSGFAASRTASQTVDQTDDSDMLTIYNLFGLTAKIFRHFRGVYCPVVRSLLVAGLDYIFSSLVCTLKLCYLHLGAHQQGFSLSERVLLQACFFWVHHVSLWLYCWKICNKPYPNQQDWHRSNLLAVATVYGVETFSNRLLLRFDKAIFYQTLQSNVWLQVGVLTGATEPVGKNNSRGIKALYQCCSSLNPNVLTMQCAPKQII